MKTRVAIMVPTPAPYRACEYDKIQLALADEIEFKAMFFEDNLGDMDWADDRFPKVMPYEVLPKSRWQEPLRRATGHRSWRVNTGVVRRLEEWRPDVVYLHAYDSPSHWQAFRWARRHGKRLLFRSDANLLGERPAAEEPFKRKLFRPLKQTLLRYLFSRIDAFLTVGTRNEEYYRFFGGDAGKFYRACYTFDDELVHSLAEQSRRTRPVPAPVEAAGDANSTETGAEKTILFVGRLIPVKSIDILIRAFQALRRQRPQVRLEIIGEGYERPVLEALAAAAPAGISFLGYRDLPEIAAHYGRAAVFVLPGRWEAYGFVVAEAMAAGLPVVVSDAAGVTVDLVVDGQTGLTIPPGDPEALRRALERVLFAEDSRPWGANARRHWLNWRNTFDVAEQTRRAVLGLPSLVLPSQLATGQVLWKTSTAK